MTTSSPTDLSGGERDTSKTEYASQPDDFDSVEALDDLLSDVGLSSADSGASVSFAGLDPILPAAHRLGACIGVPLMAGAVAAVAFHKHRGGPRPGPPPRPTPSRARHQSGAFWHPTLNGEVAPHPLILDNPFLVAPYRTANGRLVMASAVYPHLAARWCRFLDVPPDSARVAEAIAIWDAFELEEKANEAGLPICIVRTPAEWLAHEQGALLATQPVIGLERIGDAPARDYGPSQRPFDDIRVLSFTHAVAGPTVGRTFAEHGADVLVRHPTRTTTSTNTSTPRPMSAPEVPMSTWTTPPAKNGQ